MTRIRIRKTKRSVLLGAAMAAVVAAPALAAGPTTERVSVRANGIEGNGSSYGCAISGDGRFVGYATAASNIVNNDENNRSDVVLFDREAKTPELVSVRTNGTQGDNSSQEPSVSHTGRYVAFSTRASNLAIKGDRNGATDVFVHDRSTGKTNRVSITSDLKEANASSYDPFISANGRYVAFTSAATNLAVKGDTNRRTDIFVHDRSTLKTNRVSIRSDLKQANGDSFSSSISSDGRLVVFASYASNLVPNDTNNSTDVFVYNRATRRTTRLSIASNGTQANGSSGQPMISPDGAWVAFSSLASNLVANDGNKAADIFVHEIATGTTTRVSTGPAGTESDGSSYLPAISEGGRYIAFQSYATNLVAGDTNGGKDTWRGADIFVHDRATGRTERVSVSSTGEEANGPSEDPGDDPSISADGRFVCFASAASNLVEDDTNQSYDIFVRGPLL